MRKIICIIMSVVLCTGTFVGCNGETSNNNRMPEEENTNEKDEEGNSNKSIDEIATQYVDFLLNKKYDEAFQTIRHDGDMEKAIQSGQLINQYKQAFESLGKFIEIKETTTTKSGEYEIISIPAKFENQNVNINVVFDSERRISGLNFGQYEDANEQQENIELPEGVIETEIRMDTTTGGILPGTLTTPAEGKNFPCVILVHGSGPNDRDETIYDNKPFRDIAWGLAEQGIATYRYDKRTKVYQNEIMNDYKITLKEETINDAVDAVGMLKDLEDIDEDKIYVLGHSLGGYAIPKIAEGSEGIAGCIIMAGSVRSLEDIIKDQYQYLAKLDGTVTEEEQSQIEWVETEIKKLKDLNIIDSKTSILGTYKSYWQYLKSYNPIETAKKIVIPMLVLQGERDYQVTMTEYNLWKGAFGSRDNWSYITYGNLNHLMMSGEGMSNPEEYKVKNNVDKIVIDDIVRWIDKN